ncbi:IS66 family insertion sequence element accessory protein TnpB [Vibrio cholerae]|uniref:Transposase n=1 Tax=Vibrio tarriae TaxID=2014742 RepID=A0AAU8WSY4_9VIBR|nr:MULTISPECIES: transposase [Vibrio]ASK56363.1 transposase [Vibrio tarriae]EJL6268216.1 IS66 family insertion sequence element accessory protein TnpB [Vibrio cholerae]EJL6282629.1 IS66 family insertion sequence element accessory protein TnpB [Vibrio cholerae]EJX9126233.1 IS66 family insertion sequence element accessory protein TnpB [Vibrio cholerae]EJY0789563.1 IS66 family insertion sequence element accessory protein TnpB [Vibrio cholerae]
MAKRRTHQEWRTLFEHYESSQLSQRLFCERNGLSLSTFYAKRQQLKHIEKPNTVDFIKAEVVEKTTRYQATQIAVDNMTLLVNDVELSIPQGTPATYLAELIGALS